MSGDFAIEQSTTVFTLQSDTGTAGDLSFTLTCRGGSSDPYSFFNVTLAIDIYVDDELVASQTFAGFANVSGTVRATVPAATRDRPVRCEVYSDGAYAIVNGVLFGSGPATMNLLLDAFLPYEYVSVPGDFILFGYDIVAEGDNRGFQAEGGTVRIFQTLDLKNPAVFGGDILLRQEQGAEPSTDYHAPSSLTAYPGVVLTHPFDGWDENAPAGGELKSEARLDGILDDNYLKIRSGTSTANQISCGQPERLGPDPSRGTSSARVHCTAQGYHAYSMPIYPIEWDLTLTFTFGLNQIEYQIQGCKTAFPAFEAYGNHHSMMEIPDSGQIHDLERGCTASVNQTGVIR